MKTKNVGFFIVSPYQEMKEVIINSNFNLLDHLMFKGVSRFVENLDDLEEAELVIDQTTNNLCIKLNGLVHSILPQKGSCVYIIASKTICSFDGQQWS